MEDNEKIVVGPHTSDCDDSNEVYDVENTEECPEDCEHADGESPPDNEEAEYEEDTD